MGGFERELKPLSGGMLDSNDEACLTELLQFAKYVSSEAKLLSGKGVERTNRGLPAPEHCKTAKVFVSLKGLGTTLRLLPSTDGLCGLLADGKYLQIDKFGGVPGSVAD
jgi:hypothetical protein